MAIDKKEIKEFAKRWKGIGYEKGDTQQYWLQLLRALGYTHSDDVKFEYHLPGGGFIDVWIRDAGVLVEQKGIEIDLDKPEPRQGKMKTPLEQAIDYVIDLPLSEQPRFIITCNFERFRIYDRERYGKSELAENAFEFTLEELATRPDYLNIIVDPNNSRLEKEKQVSIEVGHLIGQLYDLMRKGYIDPDSDASKHALNVLCVRLVFCLYCEDADLFPKDAFYNYLKDVPAQNIRMNLKRLFKALDTEIVDRDPYDTSIKGFPYVNGGLFKEDTEIPNFSEEAKDFLLNKVSAPVNWAQISPTIFGGIFESTLYSKTRREGGMHYTSPENIHKVIDPLFLNDLKKEFTDIRDDLNLTPRQKKNRYRAFHKKICSLKFLDPAAGSGNFLTETYICLRKLEDNLLMELLGGQASFALEEDEDKGMRVSLNQFYGIEINDFAVTVAETALWISRLKANGEESMLLSLDNDFPLSERANIICENALRFDWNDLIEPSAVSYIMGNPPFITQAKRKPEQSLDMKTIFGEGSPETKLDYVLCWYKKSLEYIKQTSNPIDVAFVSTNSICQGESIPTFWKNIIAEGLRINYAYRSFEWDNESSDSAAVSCVIVGFSLIDKPDKQLFIGTEAIKAKHINAYLIDYEDIWLVSRSNNPPAGMPKLIKGSEPTDCRGNLFLSSDEKDFFLSKYPELESYIRPFVGGDEFTNNLSHHFDRYCFWFDNVDISKFNYIQELTDRFNRIAEARSESTADRIRKRASVPHLFCQIRQPSDQYVVFPRHTSSDYAYLPLGYLTPDVIVGDACYILSNTPLYLFGILESSIHKYWVELVAGRLGDAALRYTPAVYNNFPWIEFSDSAKERIADTAQVILNARASHLDQPLSLLYNTSKMPLDLKMAHEDNDKAVMDAYGFSYDMTESEIVAELMRMYQQHTEN